MGDIVEGYRGGYGEEIGEAGKQLDLFGSCEG
jgi:hypothetical protein